MQDKRSSLLVALCMMALGHLLAMMAILLPFTLMKALFLWETELRIGAGAVVILMGVYLLINRRHPKFLARIHPARLALWSFLAAMAHGAGLMLVPIYLGICGIDDGHTGHLAAQTLMRGTLFNAVLVAVVHTLAMTAAGGIIAAAVYFWFGLKFIGRTWFNLDIVWALSLVLVGYIGIHTAHMTH